MTIHKSDKEELDRMLYREQPSQLLVHATRSSFKRMMEHCHEEGWGQHNTWKCSATGARVKVYMTRRYVYDGEELVGNHPIGHLFCGACDQPPPKSETSQSIQAEDLQTLSM